MFWGVLQTRNEFRCFLAVLPRRPLTKLCGLARHVLAGFSSLLVTVLDMLFSPPLCACSACRLRAHVHDTAPTSRLFPSLAGPFPRPFDVHYLVAMMYIVHRLLLAA